MAVGGSESQVDGALPVLTHIEEEEEEEEEYNER